MKVFPFKIPKPNDDALVYQEDVALVFYDKLHQHEEIQVSYIAEGEGTLVVGDGVNTYSKGDIIVIGSRLPHVFKSEASSKESVMLSLFFSEDSFGKGFFELAELDKARLFFTRAENGFRVLSHKQAFMHYFNVMRDCSKLERFISLLKIMEVSSKCKVKSLSSFRYDKQYSDIEGKRMRDVLEYTMTHYKEHITLGQIAEISAMTKNAFCKYFKKRTNKSYFKFLNELRIEHACKLLGDNKDQTIADIAERSGFNNISNFNRQFRSIKHNSPSAFRNHT